VICGNMEQEFVRTWLKARTTVMQMLWSGQRWRPSVCALIYDKKRANSLDGWVNTCSALMLAAGHRQGNLGFKSDSTGATNQHQGLMTLYAICCAVHQSHLQMCRR